MYSSCKIYQGYSVYKDDYISETERNIIITRWGERYNPMNDSELANHLKKSELEL